MKGIAKWVVLSALLSAIWGCCPCKDLPKQSTSQQNDSTITEIRWREIHIHDTVPLYIPVGGVSSEGEDSSHLETDYATSDAWVDSLGKLHHNLDNKPQEVPVAVDLHVKVSDTSKYDKHTKIDSIPYPEYIEKELTRWQQTEIRGFWVLLIAGILFVAWKTRKTWMKFLK